MTRIYFFGQTLLHKCFGTIRYWVIFHFIISVAHHRKSMAGLICPYPNANQQWFPLFAPLSYSLFIWKTKLESTFTRSTSCTIVRGSDPHLIPNIKLVKERPKILFGFFYTTHILKSLKPIC